MHTLRGANGEDESKFVKTLGLLEPEVNNLGLNMDLGDACSGLEEHEADCLGDCLGLRPEPNFTRLAVSIRSRGTTGTFTLT